MKLSDFDYELPKELIAQLPLRKRDASRLLVLNRKSKNIQHKSFGDIINYLNNDDILVVNDTRVLPARLIGRKNTGGKVDCLLLEKKSENDFHVLLKPRDLKIGQRVYFNGSDLGATVIDRKILRFDVRDERRIYKHGVMPLPPYIKRIPQAQDFKRYQTVFADRPGAIAAPTAGLHFTKELLSKLKRKGLRIVKVTLHINYATFKPVREDNIIKHRMYKEYYQISKNNFSLIRQAKQSGKRIICVGTTCVRVLESLADFIIDSRSSAADYRGWTDLFIYPGYKFKMVDGLLTNFHLPRTTLLMLVCAFAGLNNIMTAYRQAVRHKYRFYSYGDAMLVI